MCQGFIQELREKNMSMNSVNYKNNDKEWSGKHFTVARFLGDLYEQ